jgi:hypothetical protein
MDEVITPVFGQRGVLTTNGKGRIQCHWCGKWWIALGTHVKAHGISANEYRRMFGLSCECGLVNKWLHERFQQASGQRLKLCAKEAAAKQAEMTRKPDRVVACKSCGSPFIQRQARVRRVTTCGSPECISASRRAGRKGQSLTREHRLKIGAAHKGKTYSQAFKDRISEQHKGKTLTLGHRQRISKGLLRHHGNSV